MARIGTIGLIPGVLLAGGLLLFWATDGGSTFTAETARRAAVAEAPRPLPATMLEDQDGMATSLDAYRGRVVLAEFVYTRCTTLCTILGATFENLRDTIEDEGLAGDVALLSISFDPDHDGPDELTDFALRFGGADPLWTFARPRDRHDMDALLDAAEVIVIPDNFGGFIHNAAIHVIDADGNLVRIVDSDAGAEALAIARDLLGRRG